MVASLGRFGKWDANSERDLHRWTRNLFDTQLERYNLRLEVIQCRYYGVFAANGWLPQILLLVSAVVQAAAHAVTAVVVVLCRPLCYHFCVVVLYCAGW